MYVKSGLSLAILAFYALANPIHAFTLGARQEVNHVNLQKACMDMKPDPGWIGWLATASFDVDWVAVFAGLATCGQGGCVIDDAWKSGAYIALFNDECTLIGATGVEPLGSGNGFKSTCEAQLPDGVRFNINAKMDTIDAGEFGGISNPREMWWYDGTPIDVDNELQCGKFHSKLDGVDVGAFKMCRFPAK